MQPPFIIAKRGFSLLECLVSLFIMAILVNTLLRHQLFLLQTQQAINQDLSLQILHQNNKVLSSFSHLQSQKS